MNQRGGEKIQKEEGKKTGTIVCDKITVNECLESDIRISLEEQNYVL